MALRYCRSFGNPSDAIDAVRSAIPNKDGSIVEYVQLAHNVRHPEKGYAKAEVIYSFGRREQLDIEALQRLVASISRFFSPEEQVRLQATTRSPEPLEFIRSRPAGGAYLLKPIWDRINIKQRLEKDLMIGTSLLP